MLWNVGWIRSFVGWISWIFWEGFDGWKHYANGFDGLVFVVYLENIVGVGFPRLQNAMTKTKCKIL